ncbi:hypothetical protein GOV10_04480, partial [Candidatus Woesearchaeota archaeon]|nr:hypothetical protein [Candidatus Woesearchaeota archaeon]
MKTYHPAIDLLCCDVENTLVKTRVHLDNGKVAPSLWTAIAEELGPEALDDEEALKDKFVAGKYLDYASFVVETVMMHQKHDLHKNLFDEVITRADYILGVPEAIEEMQDMGINHMIAVSGGFTALCDRIKEELRFDMAFGACEMIWDENYKVMACRAHNTDYGDKIRFLESYIKKHDINPERVGFVGDGKNDAQIAEYVINNGGIAVSFGGQEELEQVPDIEIMRFQGEK